MECCFGVCADVFVTCVVLQSNFTLESNVSDDDLAEMSGQYLHQRAVLDMLFCLQSLVMGSSIVHDQLCGWW